MMDLWRCCFPARLLSASLEVCTFYNYISVIGPLVRGFLYLVSSEFPILRFLDFVCLDLCVLDLHLLFAGIILDLRS